MKRRYKINEKTIDQDVVLLRTYNHAVSNRACEVLISDSIPFKRSFKKIPFFLRETYKADEICTISINRNVYSKARRSIDRLDIKYQERLLLNYI